MRGYDWFLLSLNVFSAVILPIALLVIRSIARQAREMRLNELRHIEERLIRVEALGVALGLKLDEHLRYHLEHPWN